MLMFNAGAGLRAASIKAWVIEAAFLYCWSDHSRLDVVGLVMVQIRIDVYAVVKMGVYQHGTWGPFFSIKTACDNAQRLANEDTDDYHGYEVCSLDHVTGLGEVLGTAYKQSADPANGNKSDLPE